MQIHFFSLICCLLYGFKLIERWLFKISHKNYHCDTQCTFERKRYNTSHGQTSRLVEALPFVFEFDHITCLMYDQVDISSRCCRFNNHDECKRESEHSFLSKKMEGSQFLSMCMCVCREGPSGAAQWDDGDDRGR